MLEMSHYSILVSFLCVCVCGSNSVLTLFCFFFFLQQLNNTLIDYVYMILIVFDIGLLVIYIVQ